VAVCAVTIAGPVGIDAEPLSRGADVLRVLDCFTTPEERASITQPEDAVWLWTAKEALVKASGEGLTGVRRSSTWLPLTRWTINRRYAVTVAASPGTCVTPVAFLATDHFAAATEAQDSSDCWAH
jgi:phosphopantetheinyl transferase